MSSDPESPELALLPALEVRRLILAREVSPREAAAACLRRIRAIDDRIRSFVTIDEDMVMAMADDVERRLKEGAALPLAGIPYALKDLTDTAGLRTTYGSRLREHNVPARDAAVARRLREAGGVLLGKTNTPEFGNRATTAYGLFPATRNPWDLGRTAGGSSGGSAAAVAACLCPIAEGSDGGGSIRIPSSCCGVVGIKPSRGRVSNHPNANPRGGLITHGPIARTVSDAALMLDVMAGAEPGDPFVAPVQTPSFLDASGHDPGSLRIGMLDTSDKWIDPQVVAAVHQAADLLASLGHRVEPAEVDLTGLGTGVPGDGRGRERRQRRRRPRAVQRPLLEMVLREGRAADGGRVHPRHGRDVPPQPGDHPGVDAVGLPPHAHRHPAAATARYVPRRHGARCRRRSRLHPVHLSVQHLGTAGDLATLGLDGRRAADRCPAGRSAVRRGVDHRARRAGRAGSTMGGRVPGATERSRRIGWHSYWRKADERRAIALLSNSACSQFPLGSRVAAPRS